MSHSPRADLPEPGKVAWDIPLDVLDAIAKAERARIIALIQAEIAKDPWHGEARDRETLALVKIVELIQESAK
jgi:hypothetical protein